MKRKFILLFPAFLWLLSSCGKSGPANVASIEGNLTSGKEVASLGDAEIHEGFILLLSRVNPNIEGQIKNPAGKKRLVDSLLEQELFYQESLKRGIDKLPAVQEKAALYSRVIIAQALLDEEIKKKAKEYYETNKDKEFSRVKIAHILIRPKPPQPAKPGQPPPKVNQEALDTEASKKAQEAKVKLDGGMAWEEAVTTFSDDAASKAKGGDIGYLSKEDRRASRLGWEEIVEKSFTMKVGEVAGPFKAKDGYHIIKLLEAANVAPFEEVHNTIEFKLRPQVKNELLSSLSKGNSIVYEAEDLKALGQKPGPPVPLQVTNPATQPKPEAAKKPEATAKPSASPSPKKKTESFPK